MQSRNVIISLVIVIVLLIFSFIKIRLLEPKKKLLFNRNPSRIEYSAIALCHMACYGFSADDVTEVLRNGEIKFSESDKQALPCPVFVLYGKAKSGREMHISVSQCGKLAKIKSCSIMNSVLYCDCQDK